MNEDDNYEYNYEDDYAQIEEEDEPEPKLVNKSQRLEVKKYENIKLFCDVEDLGIFYEVSLKDRNCKDFLKDNSISD